MTQEEDKKTNPFLLKKKQETKKPESSTENLSSTSEAVQTPTVVKDNTGSENVFSLKKKEQTQQSITPQIPLNLPSQSGSSISNSEALGLGSQKPIKNNSEAEISVTPSSSFDDFNFGETLVGAQDQIQSPVLLDIDPQLETLESRSKRRKSLRDGIRLTVLNNPSLLEDIDGVDDSLFSKILSQTNSNDLAQEGVDLIRELRIEKDILSTETNASLDFSQTQENVDIFNNINKANLDLKKKELIGSGFSEEEADKAANINFPQEEIIKSEDLFLNTSKIKDDYLNFLQKSKPEKFKDLSGISKAEELLGVSSQSRNMKFLQEALEHQGRIIDSKIKNTISKAGDDIKDSDIDLIESLESQKERLSKRYEGLISEFPEVREKMLENKRSQEAVDERYRQAKAKALQPGFDGDVARARVLYENVVSPIGSASVGIVGNLVKFGLNQVSGLSDNEVISGTSDIVSDWANGFFDTEKSGSIYKKPSALKGALFENGDLQSEKLIPKTTETLFNMVALLSGGSSAAGAVELTGLAASTSQKIGLVASSFVLSQNDYYEEAKSLGLSNSESNNFANAASLITSTLELINPQNQIFGKESKKLFTKKVIDAVKDGVDLKSAIKENSKFVAKEIIGENAQEFSQEASSLGVKYLFNKKNEDDIFDVTINADQIKEMVLLTSIVSGAGSAPGLKNRSKLEIESLFGASQDLEAFKKLASSKEAIDQFGEKELEKAVEKAEDYKKVVDGLPENISTQEKIDLANLVFKKKKINESRKDVFVDEKVAENSPNTIDSKIEEIDSEISELFNNSKDTKIDSPLKNISINLNTETDIIESSDTDTDTDISESANTESDTNTRSGTNAKSDTEYKIDGKFFSESEIIEQLSNDDFKKSLLDGKINLSISNPSENVSNIIAEAGVLTSDQIDSLPTSVIETSQDESTQTLEPNKETDTSSGVSSSIDISASSSTSDRAPIVKGGLTKESVKNDSLVAKNTNESPVESSVSVGEDSVVNDIIDKVKNQKDITEKDLDSFQKEADEKDISSPELVDEIAKRRLSLKPDAPDNNDSEKIVSKEPKDKIIDSLNNGKDSKKIKTSLSDRINSSKTISKEAKNIFNSFDSIDVEKQDDVISNAKDFVSKSSPSEVVELFSDNNNIDEKNRSFVIASLYKAGEDAHSKSINKKLSKSERLENAKISAKAFKTVEAISVSGGRGSAIQQKLIEESSIGLSIKTISKIRSNKSAALSKDDKSLGRKREEVVEGIRKSINKVVEGITEKDIESIINENKRLKSKINSITNKTPKKTTAEKTTAEKKEKANKKISNALAKLKKSTKTSAPLSGLSTDGIEALADLIIGYVQLGSLNAKQIIKRVRSNLKSIGVEATDSEIESIADKISEFSDLKKQNKQDLKKSITEGDVRSIEDSVSELISSKNISDIAKDYYKSKSQNSRSLSEELSSNLGISESDSKLISTLIEKSINKKIKESIDKELNKKLKLKKNLTREEKKIKSDTLKENSKLSNKIIDIVNLGGLNTAEFVNSFSEKYDFVEVTDDIINELNTITSLINKAEEVGALEIRNKAVVRLNNLIGDLKAKDAKFYAEMIRELDFLSALSGINTQGNSMAGASLGTITNFVSDSIRSGGIFSSAWRYAVMKSFSPSNLKAAISAAKDSAKTNHSKFNSISYFDFNQRSNNKQGSIERQILKGVLGYLKGVKKENNLTDNSKAIVKTIGQSLLQGYRMSFLLMAQDTLLTSINSEYLSAKEEYLRRSKDLGLKGFNTIIGNKDLARSVDKKLGFDQINDFEIKAQEELNDFYNDIVDQVDSDIDEGFIVEKQRESIIDSRAKELFGSSFYNGWKLKLFGGNPTSKYNRYISRRVKEMLDAKKEEDIYRDAVEISKDWVSMSSKNVDGLHGEFNRQIQKSFSFKENDNTANLFFKLVGTALIKFTRIAAVTASNIQNSIPVAGLIPTVVGVGRDSDDQLRFGWKWKQNKELMTRRIVTNMVMTGATALIFDHMFKWDEEEEDWKLEDDRLVDFTGVAFDDWAKNLQSEEGRVDFGVRFRSSPESEWKAWRSLKYLPQALPLTGIIGGLSDNIKGFESSKEKKENNDRSKFSKVVNKDSFLNLPMKSMMEGTFNSLGRSVKRIVREKDESSASAVALNELILQPAKNLAQPAFIRDVFNEYRSFKGGNIKESNDFYEKMTKDFYMMDTFNRDKTDLFGNSIPKQSRFDNWYRGYLKMSEKHKELELIFKYPSLTIPYYQPPGTISSSSKRFSFGKSGFKNRTFRQGYTIDTDEAKDFLMDTQKKEFKSLVLKNFKKLDILSQVDLDRELRILRNESIESAKRETISKFKDTDNIKLKD